VPVDRVDGGGAVARVRELLESPQHEQVILLSMESFARARRDPEYSRAVRQAALVVSVTRRLEHAARMLRHPEVRSVVPFDLIIRILDAAESAGSSVYLLGGRKEQLERAEKNLRASFPKLRLVGRHAGFYAPRVEQDIITAIRKSAPRVLLVGSGVPGGELWPLRRRRQLTPGISVWVADCFEVFAGARRPVPRGVYEAGLESYSGWITHPWRLLRVFRDLWFWVAVLVHRFRRR
jgi:N-acetylglucosaminyldiphosphoundecaprenol N-acetyl-beta-D-mannosaminyltransferase